MLQNNNCLLYKCNSDESQISILKAFVKVDILNMEVDIPNKASYIHIKRGRVLYKTANGTQIYLLSI